MHMKYDIVGKTFTDNAGNSFVVKRIEYIDERRVAHYFCEYESGWTTITRSGNIRSGEVKDMLSPSVFGVGCLGYASGYATRKGNRRIYYTWRNMIRRCYDKEYRAYKWYGAKGVSVCDRWKRLDYFVEDISKIRNFDLQKFNSGELELDKDIYGDHKIYSLETCCFVSHAENAREANKRRFNKQ